jgi:hypothetical protein
MCIFLYLVSPPILCLPCVHLLDIFTSDAHTGLMSSWYRDIWNSSSVSCIVIWLSMLSGTSMFSHIAGILLLFQCIISIYIKQAQDKLYPCLIHWFITNFWIPPPQTSNDIVVSWYKDFRTCIKVYCYLLYCDICHIFFHSLQKLCESQDWVFVSQLLASI